MNPLPIAETKAGLARLISELSEESGLSERMADPAQNTHDAEFWKGLAAMDADRLGVMRSALHHLEGISG